MKKLSLIVAGASLAMLQACAAEPDETAAPDQGVVQSSEQPLTTCSTANGKWPMAAALAVAIAKEIGEINVVRDFASVNGKLAVTTTKCTSSTSACPNIKAILTMQDLGVNKMPGGLTQTMFDANIFASALTNMRQDQLNWENSLPADVKAELALGHTLKSSSAFTPAATSTCGIHYYFKAYKKNTTTALPHPEWLKHRLWAFGATSNPYIAFSYSATEAKIAIDPDETANVTPAASGSCTTYTLDKVYDPLHTLVGKCCTLSATGQTGTLKIGLAPAIKWDFCVAI